jgi:NAD-dependent SIR2 family protein deacetylase
MNNWHCNKCKVAVEVEDIDAVFLDYDFSYEGLVCPECGETWLTEEVVVDEISPAEDDAEAKMA